MTESDLLRYCPGGGPAWWRRSGRLRCSLISIATDLLHAQGPAGSGRDAEGSSLEQRSPHGPDVPATFAAGMRPGSMHGPLHAQYNPSPALTAKHGLRGNDPEVQMRVPMGVQTVPS